MDIPEDQSIKFSKLNESNEYGGKVFIASRVIKKCDTSTSIVVDWRKEKKIIPYPPEKELKQIIYKESIYTDGNKKGEKLDLKMNILFHPSSPKPSKLILMIPGGGFLHCHIDSNILLTRLNIVKHNFAMINIEYHLSGNGIYKDALNDISDAIKFIKKNGEKYNIDTNKIVIMGNSAGGHLCSLYAILHPNEISGVINLYGTSDVTKIGDDFDEEYNKKLRNEKLSISQFIYGVFNNKNIFNDSEKEYDKINPINYINGNEPPFLFMHGDSDICVSPSQTLLLHNQLRKNNVKSIRYSLTGDGHGDGGFDTECAINVMVDFLNQIFNSNN